MVVKWSTRERDEDGLFVRMRMEESIMVRRTGLLMLAVTALALTLVAADSAEAFFGRRGGGSCGSSGGSSGSWGGSSGGYGSNGSCGGSFGGRWRHRRGGGSCGSSGGYESSCDSCSSCDSGSSCSSCDSGNSCSSCDSGSSCGSCS